MITRKADALHETDLLAFQQRFSKMTWKRFSDHPQKKMPVEEDILTGFLFHVFFIAVSGSKSFGILLL